MTPTTANTDFSSKAIILNELYSGMLLKICCCCRWDLLSGSYYYSRSPACQIFTAKHRSLWHWIAHKKSPVGIAAHRVVDGIGP